MTTTSSTERTTANREAAVLAGVRTGLFIGGSWRPATGGGTFAVDDPATQEVLDPGRRRHRRGRARRPRRRRGRAGRTGPRTPPRDRGEILRRAFELITARADDLALLMTLEMGKPVKESKAEIAYAAEFFRWFSEEAVRIAGRWSVAPNGASRLLTMKQPVGPVPVHHAVELPDGDGHPQDRPGGRGGLHDGRQAGAPDPAVDVRPGADPRPRRGCPTASST